MSLSRPDTISAFTMRSPVSSLPIESRPCTGKEVGQASGQVKGWASLQAGSVSQVPFRLDRR